jgi:hypothetical protein
VRRLGTSAAAAKTPEPPREVTVEPVAEVAALPVAVERVGPRRGPPELLRFSHLRTLGQKSPAHLAAGIEQDETASMQKGSALHALVFQTHPVVFFPGRRVGKEYRAFVDGRAPDAIILTETAYEQAAAMAAAPAIPNGSAPEPAPAAPAPRNWNEAVAEYAHAHNCDILAAARAVDRANPELRVAHLEAVVSKGGK